MNRHDGHLTITDVIVTSLLLAVSDAQHLYSQLDHAPARITEAPRSVKVLDNSVLSLVCRASGNPVPEISWSRGGRRLLPTSPKRYTIIDITGGSVLWIKPVKARWDDGFVDCVANNEVSEPATARASIRVYTRDNVPAGFPQIVESPTLKAVEKGRATVMLCSASGNPVPTVSWYKDSVPVDISDPRLHILPTGSLQIRRSAESDQGKYECVAENSVGLAISYGANLYVRVRSIPPHFSIPPESVEVLPGGAANLTCVAVGSPTPVVTWHLGSVQLDNSDDDDDDVDGDGGGKLGKNILMLRNLGKSATYTCVAASDLGNIAYDVDVIVKALPSAPTSVLVTAVTANSISVSWNAAPTDVSDPIMSYTVQYRPKTLTVLPDTRDFHQDVTPGFREIRDVTDTEYDVTGLEAFTLYELRVISVNSVGRSEPSQSVDATTSQLAPGSAPVNVEARPLSSSTVVVEWNEPLVPNGLIQGYRVYYTLTPELPVSLWTVHEVSDNSLLTTVTHLLEHRTYSLRVLAFTDVGDGPLSHTVHVNTSTDVEREFKSDDVGPPRNFEGEVRSANSIQLTWTEPLSQSGGGSIESYELYYNDTHFRQNVRVTISPTYTTYLLSDLTSATVYHLRLAARTSRGEGPSTDTIQLQTLDYVPGQPRRFRVEVLNSSSVVVQWRPPDDRLERTTGIVRGYRVQYVAVDDVGDAVEDTSRVVDVANNSRMEAVVGGLQADCLYQFDMWAYTRRTEGQRTRQRRVKTLGAVPTAPRDLQLSLTQLDPPIVLVTWTRPVQSHGPLSGYKLTYGVVSDSYIEERRFDSDKFRFTTGFLERGADYEFRLSAKNLVDYGQTAVQTLRTPDGIPSGAPQNFTAIGVSPTSVRLQWDLPAKKHRHGSIVLYEVVYHQRAEPLDDFATNTSDLSTLIEGLEPNTDYTFQLRAYTSKGPGPWNNRLPFRTFGSYGVSAPVNVRLQRISSRVVEVSWDAPAHHHHRHHRELITGYRVYYHRSSSSVAPPRGGHLTDSHWEVTDVDGPLRVTQLTGLKPHTRYTVRVRARGVDGRLGNFSEPAISDDIDSDTEYHHPDAVQEFQATSQNPQSMILEWKPPRTPGVFRYTVDYEGVRKYHDPVTGIEETLVDPHKTLTVAKEQQTVYVTDLMPRTVYSVNISAKFIDGSWGPITNLHTETSSDAPADIEAPVVLQIMSDGSVQLRLLPALDASVTEYFVVVVPDQLTQNKRPQDFTLDELKPDSGYTDKSQVHPWVAARFDAASYPAEFVLGDGQRQIIGSYFNRPLRFGHNHRVFVRALAPHNRQFSSAFSDPLLIPTYPHAAREKSSDEMTSSQVLVADAATDEVDTLWIVAPVCVAVVCILVLALIIVLTRRRRLSWKHSTMPVDTSSTKKVSLMPVNSTQQFTDTVELRRLHFHTPAMLSHPAVNLVDLSAHVARLKSNDCQLFSHEYESIDPGQQFTWEASSTDENKFKNRYANVIAYDHSRVKLESFDGLPGCSDYINANFIDGYCRPNAYIATQGPLCDTVSDFWRMIWQYHCPAIVMMTKLEERNRSKCDEYWPSRGSELYGWIHVTLADVIELATYTVRTFHLAKEASSERREVRQFQFTAWPDHGVPQHPTPLLLFMRRVKFMTPPDSGPTVVHCSAGVGRTGTFIVIDSMLERIKHVDTVDIYGHVTCLRAQRNYMVQTEDQYVFIHDAVLEAITSGNTEILARNLSTHVRQLLQPLSDHRNALQLEFQRLISTKRSRPEQFVSANLPSNKHKNRYATVLPFESSRVFLQPIRGIEGSDYINASFIDGYRVRRSYIATQGPLAETTEDLWRMLWEHSSNIVVMLCPLRDQLTGRDECYQYWPSDRSARYQYFVVDPLAEYNMPQYVLREFKVTDARDGQSRTIRQFQFTDWPELGVPSSGETFIEFIGQVHKTKEQFGHEGPITVHCTTGIGQTGVFVALSIVLERMRFEGVVDMFQTVNILRTQRPSMVHTEEEYRFCYEAALNYLSSFDHYTS